MSMTTRWERCLALATEQDADAVLVTSAENRRYLSGFTGSNGVLYISPTRRLLVTDRRYGYQAEREAPGWDVTLHGLDRERDVACIVAAGVRAAYPHATPGPRRSVRCPSW